MPELVYAVRKIIIKQAKNPGLASTMLEYIKAAGDYNVKHKVLLFRCNHVVLDVRDPSWHLITRPDNHLTNLTLTLPNSDFEDKASATAFSNEVNANLELIEVATKQALFIELEPILPLVCPYP